MFKEGPNPSIDAKVLITAIGRGMPTGDGHAHEQTQNIINAAEIAQNAGLNPDEASEALRTGNMAGPPTDKTQ